MSVGYFWVMEDEPSCITSFIFYKGISLHYDKVSTGYYSINFKILIFK